LLQRDIARGADLRLLHIEIINGLAAGLFRGNVIGCQGLRFAKEREAGVYLLFDNIESRIE